MVRGQNEGDLGRGRAGLDAALAEARASGAEAVAVVADMADPKAVEHAAEMAEREVGPIDVEIEPEEFRRVAEVTYLEYVYATRAALRDAAA
ncbi:NAD(P)-dependent dehydrogenase (short-subunit alcohol dehydrogenase family) [Kitasatospora sp. GP82]|nr:NAD(P)-dependent dehydrogenase (short-subunit alcohol dehydrogenase family) [Kitasatospora sp. GP82]